MMTMTTMMIGYWLHWMTAMVGVGTNQGEAKPTTITQRREVDFSAAQK